MSQSILYRPSIHNPGLQRGDLYASKVRPFSSGQGLSIKIISVIISFISALLGERLPSAITGLIISVIVNSTKRMLGGRPLSHILRKLFIRLPRIAYRYAARAIIFEFMIPWIGASPSHITPYVPERILGFEPLFLQNPAFRAAKKVWSTACYAMCSPYYLVAAHACSLIFWLIVEGPHFSILSQNGAVQVLWSGLGTGATAAIIGGISAAGSVGSSLIGSHAAGSAAKSQEDSAQQALDFQKQVYGDQKANQQPFVDAGQANIGKLMSDISASKYGTGSNPNFVAPTADEAKATPGYQFTSDQGTSAILKGAAGLGGSINGGTLKALDTYNTGLADSTYQQTYNNFLSTYNANLTKQNQEFNEMYQPAVLGENAASNINATGTQAAANVGNLMTQQGNAQAAGTIGSANAIQSGIGGATNGVLNAYLLSKLTGPGPVAPTYGPATPPGYDPATYTGSTAV